MSNLLKKNLSEFLFSINFEFSEYKRNLRCSAAATYPEVENILQNKRVIIRTPAISSIGRLCDIYEKEKDD